jgi:hypothetical protein
MTKNSNIEKFNKTDFDFVFDLVITIRKLGLAAPRSVIDLSIKMQNRAK